MRPSMPYQPENQASTKGTTAHTATVAVIHERFARLYFDPAPRLTTLRDWLIRGRVPWVKANMAAKRGGGPLYFQVAFAEKLLKRKAGLI